MTPLEIGCCGAYCKTCKVLINGNCLGCKLGYVDGKRDIRRARCVMKVCCFKEKELQTCADCDDFNECSVIHGWFNKKGYKYKKYKESIEFIRKNGYKKFLAMADTWENQYGKLC